MKCRRCGFPMPLDAQRRCTNRLRRLGFTPEQIQQIMPQCQKCLTEKLRP